MFRKHRGKKRRYQSTAKQVKTQVNMIYGFVFLSFGSLVLRLGYIEVVHGASFRVQAKNTSYQTMSVLPARGRIFDANGNLLAYDKPTYSLYYTQSSEQNLSRIANVLAPEFHTTVKNIRTVMKDNSAYATFCLFKNVNPNEISFVSEHQSTLPGVSIELDSQREYPFGTLAGQVLGYIQPINPSNKSYYVDKKKYLLNQSVGVSGLEFTYENLLQGKAGEQILWGDSQGNSVMDAASYVKPPIAGDNLQLTLDGNLQAVTQNAVQQQVTNSPYASQITDAAAVALDVKTGGVLAMVSYPYMDPNWFTTPGLSNKYGNYLATSGAQMDNAIQNPNDPGSTVKPSTLIAGLTYGAITPTQTFDSQGYLNVDGQSEKDDSAFGIVGPTTAIAESCEVYFYQIGLYLGHWFGATTSSPGGTGGIPYSTWEKKDFIKGLLDMYHTEWEFGLGPKTGIDLQGEQAGKFFNEDGNAGFSEKQIDMMKVWKQVQKAGSYDSFSTPVTLIQAATGQMQQFTPLQLAQYTATIANNGVRIQPHLLQAVYSPGMSPTLANEKPIKRVQPHVQNRLHYSLTYFKLAQQGMEGVIESPIGTAHSAFVGIPYTAAGKTGTAQIGYHGRIVDNSVFIAYAPYDHPQIAVAVMVPGAGYGATSAAAVARAMFDTYFKEHHEFFPKKEWESTTISASWKSTPAYKVPESK